MSQYEKVVDVISRPPDQRTDFEIAAILPYIRKRTQIFENIRTGEKGQSVGVVVIVVVVVMVVVGVVTRFTVVMVVMFRLLLSTIMMKLLMAIS